MFRFIGELFKQKMINPKIMLYCITNLVSQHSEEPLECLCNLFKTTGKELEQVHILYTCCIQIKIYCEFMIKMIHLGTRENACGI